MSVLHIRSASNFGGIEDESVSCRCIDRIVLEYHWTNIVAIVRNLLVCIIIRISHDLIRVLRMDRRVNYDLLLTPYQMSIGSDIE